MIALRFMRRQRWVCSSMNSSVPEPIPASCGTVRWPARDWPCSGPFSRTSPAAALATGRSRRSIDRLIERRAERRASPTGPTSIGPSRRNTSDSCFEKLAAEAEGDFCHRPRVRRNSARTPLAGRTRRRPVSRPLGRRHPVVFRQARFLRAPGAARGAHDSHSIIRSVREGIHAFHFPSSSSRATEPVRRTRF